MLNDRLRFMTESYLEAVEWTGEFEGHAFSLEALKRAASECAAFLDDCPVTTGLAPSQLGHDFWLTRNGHGTGFWDRGLEEGEELTSFSQSFGTCEAYIGDDDLIYFY